MVSDTADWTDADVAGAISVSMDPAPALELLGALGLMSRVETAIFALTLAAPQVLNSDLGSIIRSWKR